MLKLLTASILTLMVIAAPAYAQERTWRNDVKPLVAAKCIKCHGPSALEYNDWELLGDAKEKVNPRMDTYPHFMSFVVWPATGAIMRRLDDGKTSGKPGNMYQYFGATDEERAKNLLTVKEWLGEGAWNLNRWQAPASPRPFLMCEINEIQHAGVPRNRNAGAPLRNVLTAII